jgi:hypothetical protein
MDMLQESFEGAPGSSQGSSFDVAPGCSPSDDFAQLISPSLIPLAMGPSEASLSISPSLTPFAMESPSPPCTAPSVKTNLWSCKTCGFVYTTRLA